MTTTVILSSNAYGVETFSYKTIQEALSGLARLVHSSNKQYKKDHVPREIRILIPPSEEGDFSV